MFTKSISSLGWLLCFSVATACASSQTGQRMPEIPEPATDAMLVSGLCEDTKCKCSDSPAVINDIPTGKKRFRITLGPSQNEIWAKVNGQTLYKSLEAATACFYLDLNVGDHRLAMYAKGHGGFGARMQISELGTKGPWWFESFEFNCGAPGLCDQGSLRDWKESISTVDAGKHAPCGSVRMSKIEWQEGKMPDNIHPETFFLQAEMKVYKFQPRLPPGSTECTNKE